MKLRDLAREIVDAAGGGKVDPNDPTLVRACLKADALDRPIEEELEILFHAQCFPYDSPVWGRR